MHLPSTCNVNKHFILQQFETRFSALLMKPSRIMCNFAPAALAVAQDIQKENHFCIIIEKKMCQNRNKNFAKWYINYDININNEDPKNA